MPYISEDARDDLLVGTDEDTISGLTYVLYKSCLVALPEEPRYTDYNAIIGALECTKLELYRRHIAPYEDTKIEENGDVY